MQIVKVTSHMHRGFGEISYQCYHIFLSSSIFSISGGIFVDSTVHDLDICSWIAGSKPKTLYAQGSVFQRDKMPSGDNEQVIVVVTYENGAVSVTDNGRFCPFGYDQRMEVKI